MDIINDMNEGDGEDEDPSKAEIDGCGIQPNLDRLDLADQDITTSELPRPCKRRLICKGKNRQRYAEHRQVQDFFGSLSQSPELLMEIAQFLSIPDLISLYAISKAFHETVNGHMSHIMISCAAFKAPEASRIFIFNFYESLCTPDPVGRFLAGTEDVRRVPSLRWLQMVTYRQKVVRDILACMAREGHRMPKTMPLSLMKMWLTMDIATSARRVQLMHNEEYWSDNDIYNIQLFMIKLEMRFNDPIDGPADDGLKKLMLGQRSLTPLWKLLKRTAYTSPLEIIQCAVRYSYEPRIEHEGLPIFGIAPEDIGKGHLEGWGLGKIHLYRMDELIPREACRRYLNLDKHMMNMMLWGYVDPVTKENIAVSEEEMYMSDDEDGKANMPETDTESEDASMMDVDGADWETDDDDMPNGSIEDDEADSGAVGASDFWKDCGQSPT
ncbi:MAG: hypothetical protein M1818_002409 [Claussenomyces sp. TS43310]|nr:MAG: hypothetical protein M1818_002409 [Claussenomyces sp. TS43310]